MVYDEKNPTGSIASAHSVEENEVFAVGEDGVDFRTVGWIRAAMFFTKMTFAAGVLSIPSALYTLGAVVGAILIAFWGGLNTCEQLNSVPLLHTPMTNISSLQIWLICKANSRSSIHLCTPLLMARSK